VAPGNKLLTAIFRQHRFYYFFFNMDKTDFVTWLQGYILGITGIELNSDQAEVIAAVAGSYGVPRQSPDNKKLQVFHNSLQNIVNPILSQREEVLQAFIAKYGFDPDQAIQIEQRQPDGTTTWRIVRVGNPLGPTGMSGQIGSIGTIHNSGYPPIIATN
jgi:hypothetical protein